MERTISWDTDTASISFINQVLLPERFEVVHCSSVQRLATAIKNLEIRGAPALGVAGGFGIALAAAKSDHSEMDGLLSDLVRAAELLRSTRPTAVNLGWGIDRVLACATTAKNVDNAKACALSEALKIAQEDIDLCHAMGAYGASLLPDSCTVLTHCNAGSLACVEWGTALGVIRSAVRSGKSVRVIASETRPLFQGSRLTAWELENDGIDVTVIPDSAAAHVMRRGTIDAVIVGADRICNDVVFNKIGTYMHAVCARHHGIPFYVAAPYSTFDLDSTESEVIIEERSAEEVTTCNGRHLAPEGVGTLNPAFDATPLELVTAIITEQGILRQPFFQMTRMP